MLADRRGEWQRQRTGAAADLENAFAADKPQARQQQSRLS